MFSLSVSRCNKSSDQVCLDSFLGVGEQHRTFSIPSYGHCLFYDVTENFCRIDISVTFPDHITRLPLLKIENGSSNF